MNDMARAIPPAGLIRIEATRQNTLVMADASQYAVSSPDTHGGPDVWLWHIVNLGPGVLWARWDGLGFANVNDENSVSLPAGYSFADIAAPALTFAAQGATTIAFTAANET